MIRNSNSGNKGIPSNTIGAKALTRLHCYQGAEHAHAAQKPEKIEF